MAYTNTSVKELISDLEKGKYVLPAIQRTFVWDESQICVLFDSLMKEYPIGSFLFWDVSEAAFSDFVFRSFAKEIDKRNGSPLGNQVVAEYGGARVGVLDGQQRMTSLYVALAGSYTGKVKKARKIAGDDPKRYLALNLLADVKNPAKESYEFAFLSEPELAEIALDEPGREKLWFRVSDILDMEPSDVGGFAMEVVPTVGDTLRYKEMLSIVSKNINCLYAAVTSDALSYFKTGKSLGDVVEIFERVNNRGQKVTGVDLMLSMASARAGKDMQQRLAEAIDQVRNATTSQVAFVPERGFVLTAALMATNAESLSTTNRDNYEPAAIEMINDAWDDVVTATCNAAIYVDQLGFNGQKIKASYMLPIVYYFYCLGPEANAESRYKNLTGKAEKHDREAIKEWLIRAQVKQIFIEGSGSSLRKIRNIMRDAIAKQKVRCFPLAELREAGRETRISLEVTEDDVRSMLEYTPSHAATLPLLTMINSGSSCAAYEIDHVWPQSLMSSRSKILKNIPSELQDDVDVDFFLKNHNKLGNLQLLERTPNANKSDQCFDIWLEQAFGCGELRIQQLRKIGVPEDEDLSFWNFKEVYCRRRDELADRIRRYFCVGDSLDKQ